MLVYRLDLRFPNWDWLIDHGTDAAPPPRRFSSVCEINKVYYAQLLLRKVVKDCEIVLAKRRCLPKALQGNLDFNSRA